MFYIATRHKFTDEDIKEFMDVLLIEMNELHNNSGIAPNVIYMDSRLFNILDDYYKYKYAKLNIEYYTTIYGMHIKQRDNMEVPYLMVREGVDYGE